MGYSAVTVVATPNNPVKFRSNYRLGNAPTTASVLAIKGSIENGNIIEIINNGTVDFGELGSDFCYSFNMENMTSSASGTDLTLIPGVTHVDGFITRTAPLHYPGGVKMKVRDVPGLPYNKGLMVGDYNTTLAGVVHGNPSFGTVVPINPQMEFRVSRESEQSFRSAWMCWPLDEQTNFVANSVKNEQVKVWWDYNSIDGYGGGRDLGGSTFVEKVNVYTSLFGGSWDSTANAFKMERKGGVAKSNGTNFNASSIIAAKGTDGMGIWKSDTTQRDEPLLYQTHTISSLSGNSVWTRVLSSVDGELYNDKESWAHPVNNVYWKFATHHFPGNVQGMNALPMAGNPIPSKGKGFFVACTYVAYGDSAAARVELADTAAPGPTSKAVSVCIPIYWSSSLIQVRLVEGMFWNTTLIGKYLHVYNKFNQFLGSVLITSLQL